MKRKTGEEGAEKVEEDDRMGKRGCNRRPTKKQ
jgi:hypothetical protein